MTELQGLWLRTLQRVVDRAAHEIKDSLNGVSLNVEVVRSRSVRDGLPASQLAEFASAAASQLETLALRTEALLSLARPQRPGSGVDVAETLRWLATLLVPAAKADRVNLLVDGARRSAPTSAGPEGVRLALAAGLLALMDGGAGGACRLEPGPDPVVRFSHEPAGTCSIDSAIIASAAEENIVIQRADRRQSGDAGDLLIVFPGS